MKKINSLVSTVIPTYNRASLIKRAVDSVLNQTFKDFELLVVDDYSEDNTEQIVKNYKDPRVKYLKNERNKGAQGARNTGIEAAKGEWIAFLDSDDIWYPDKLEKQVGVLNKNPDVDFIYSGQTSVYEDDSREIHLREKKENYFRALLLKNCIGSLSTVIIRRKCLLDVGLFDESLTARQDLDMWLRLSRKYNIFCISESLIDKNEMDIYSDKRVFNLSNRIESMIKILNKYRSHYKINPRIHSINLLRLAIEMVKNKDKRFVLYLLYSLYRSPAGFFQQISYILNKKI